LLKKNSEFRIQNSGVRIKTTKSAYFNVSSMNLSLPASLSETEREEQLKIQLFAPLSVSERGWGRGQIRLVELTLF
jgi:hypothetical protein